MNSSRICPGDNFPYKSHIWCIGTNSQHKYPNTLELLRAWDLSYWFLHGISMRPPTRLRHQGTACPRCCSPRLQGSLSLAQSRSTGGMFAPGVLQCSAARVHRALAPTLLQRPNSYISWGWTPHAVFTALHGLGGTKPSLIVCKEKIWEE